MFTTLRADMTLPEYERVVLGLMVSTSEAIAPALGRIEACPLTGRHDGNKVYYTLS